MTLRAILGLAALNAGFAVLGLSVLWALRGLPRWSDVLRLAGVGYLVGVAVFGTLWTQLLVVGVPFGGWAIVATLVGGTLATCVAGALLGRAPPEGFGDGRGSPTLDLLTTAAGIALIGLLLEALFRSARLQSLQAYDAWAFWVPKGKAIYLFGELDEQMFTSLPVPRTRRRPDPRRGRLPRDGRCRHRDVPPAVLVPPGRRGRGDRRMSPPPRARVAPVAVARAGARPPALRGAAPTPQADVLVDVLFVVGARSGAPWLADGGSLEARRGSGAPPARR